MDPLSLAFLIMLRKR
ncbi:UNVERIFIED_CONTAM: hypothetical protein GTU68_035429 [Idotea baltica]|nr:hypothetical protein [Idotea baltica]